MKMKSDLFIFFLKKEVIFASQKRRNEKNKEQNLRKNGSKSAEATIWGADRRLEQMLTYSSFGAFVIKVDSVLRLEFFQPVDQIFPRAVRQER